MENSNSPQKPFYLQKSFRKVYVLITLSLIGVAVISVLLHQITTTAENIKKAKIENSNVATSDQAFLEVELNNYQDEVDKLKGMIASDSDVLVFVQEVDRFRKEGVIEMFEVMSNGPMLDATGNYGLPILIKFRGSETQVDAALRGIQTLPYILRGVQTKVTKEVGEDGVETIVLEYGGFMYAEEN